MAERTLFIGWGTPVPGREDRALEVFDDAIGILGRAEQDGRIVGFDVVLLDPNRDLNGYIQVAGTVEQIAALRAHPEFVRNTADAQLAVADVRHVEGWAGAGVNRKMATYREALGEVAGDPLREVPHYA
ncbi:hypothetical protein NBH00_16425 [Paraconexibacter antarcticus]|uniref:Antibiotic biosynthesis monooxygenase n=1 Tax=Paraconexibacter antarcticus TaxID=2949664 RepID=A0ABY5DP24_9ACTN|nr:hypothetical protein [Paraconexibacter antarcticus]UTI62938.1 hypothetical protein NBH00_16425 [Paraconexibacter antarcticus]